MRKESNLIFFNHFWMLCALFIIAILLSYFYLDRPIAYYFHGFSLKEQKILNSISNIMHPELHMYLWLILFYFFRFIFKKESIANQTLFIAIAVDFCNLIILPIKMFFGRYRPEKLFLQDLYGFSFFSLRDSTMSFPSGHAVTAGAIMASLSCIYPRFFPYFLLGALGLSFLRVASTDHFLSDVLAAVFLGFLITQIIYFPMQRSSLKFHRP